MARGGTDGGPPFDPVAFLEAAVAIPSHESVDAMRSFLLETLEDLGLAPTVDGAGNVLVTRGEGRPHLVLNTHLDTVPPHVPAERDGDRLAGRGACDAKASLAAMVAATTHATVGDGRLTLAVTPDEERESRGAAALVPRLDADAVIVGEPTGLAICHAARGRFQGTITVRGSSAHAAEPERGANAILGAATVLSSLATFDEGRAGLDVERDGGVGSEADGDGRHQAASGSPEGERQGLGPPTLTPTMIEGGDAANQVPASCRITLDRRSVPPETAAEFAEAMAAHLDRVADELAPDVQVSYAHAARETPFLEPFRTDPEAAVVRALRRAGAGPVRPFGAATEASYFAREAPTAVFGPGVLADAAGPVAHAEREYVELEAVREAAGVLVAAIETVLGS